MWLTHVTLSYTDVLSKAFLSDKLVTGAFLEKNQRKVLDGFVAFLSFVNYLSAFLWKRFCLCTDCSNYTSCIFLLFIGHSFVIYKIQ